MSSATSLCSTWCIGPRVVVRLLRVGQVPGDVTLLELGDDKAVKGHVDQLGRLMLARNRRASATLTGSTRSDTFALAITKQVTDGSHRAEHDSTATFSAA